MLIKLTKILNDTWIMKDEMQQLSDDDIISLIQEDIIDFINNCIWEVIREEGEDYIESNI